jgi:crotonobetainyl-CoA:carnitine CoA-transferase CaiB-like acyl-CoA transferase
VSAGSAASPLQSIRVVDLTEGDGAPYCAMMLGDAGADVIKIEPAPAGDWARHLGPPFDEHGDGPLFIGMNRNKRSVVIDLGTPSGSKIVAELAERADVVIESFSSLDRAAESGLSYDALRMKNPGLVYCDLSVYDRRGPMANDFGSELTVQAKSGLMRFAGERGCEPVRFGTNYAGTVASFYAMQAIVAVLYAREQTGEGQYISTSSLRGSLATQQNYLTAFSDPDDPTPTGFLGDHLGPPYHGYETADGRIEMMFIYARDDDVLRKLGAALEIPALLDMQYDPYNVGRGPEWPQILADVERAFRRHTTAELIELLDGLGLMCAPVHDYRSLSNDPVAVQQELIGTLRGGLRGDLPATSPPWRLSETSHVPRRSAPLLGEHTREVLLELGWPPAKVTKFVRRGVLVEIDAPHVASGT